MALEFSEKEKGFGLFLAIVSAVLIIAAWARAQIPISPPVYDMAKVHQPPRGMSWGIDPIYPRKARDAGVRFAGEVEVPIIIREDGSVRVEMQNFSLPVGVPKGVGFRETAIKETERLRYSPGRLEDGTPVRVRSVARVIFNPNSPEPNRHASVAREGVGSGTPD